MKAFGVSFSQFPVNLNKLKLRILSTLNFSPRSFLETLMACVANSNANWCVI